MPAHDTEAHLARTRARLSRFGVDVRDDATRGRCLVAAKDFKRGDLVLASAPFGLPVPFVHAGGGSGRCAGCFRDASDEAWEDGGERSPETCAGCGGVWFCSERCKACAMAGGHASECAALRAFKKKHPGADAGSVSAEFCALSALYRQCTKDYPESAEPADEALPYLVPTLGDKDDYGARQKEKKAEAVEDADFGAAGEDDVAWARTQIASARGVGLLPKTVTDAAARLEIVRSRVNDFFIQRWTGGDPEPIAAAVFPLGALLNHSCAPTCVASYRLDERSGSTASAETESESFATWIQEFRCCVEEVKAGDELTHAYVDASDWANHRRAALFDRYGFVCVCARCPKDEHGEPFDPPKPIKSPYAEAEAQKDASVASAELTAARLAYIRESNWAALAMPNDKRSQVTIEIASKLLSDAERAEEVSKERELAEKAAGLLRGIQKTLSSANDTPYALGAKAPFPTTPMRARALAMASNMAMFESDFEAALRLGEELVACLAEAYGTKWHAKIAYELFKLASVAGDGLGDADAAAAKFREALEIGEVALGEDAWMCRKAREYLEGTSSG